MDNYRKLLLNRFVAQEKGAHWAADSFRAGTLEELLKQATANIVNQFKESICVLLLAEGDYLVIKSTAGLDINNIEHKRIPIENSFSGRLAKRGESKLFSDVSEIIDTIEDNMEPYYCGSMISTPLIFNRKVIGLLNIYRPAPSEPFSPDDFNIVTAYGRQTAFAIENRRLIDKRTEELREAQAELVQLNEQLESTNQELKSFAYVVSHDLKAPLRGIRILAEWMIGDYADKLDEEGKEQLQLLMGRVERMQSMIEGILQYSRVGRLKEEKVIVKLNELVNEVIDMVSAPENISITVEDELPVIECEQTRIMQVFQNLLSNAVKYMDKPQGVIKIGCIEENGFWKFSITDNGPGIEERHFERIFQIFQTLSSRDDFESTGIGLTITKKIVELYGGRIWVESQLGEGSTFFFTLPKQEIEVKDEELKVGVIN